MKVTAVESWSLNKSEYGREKWRETSEHHENLALVFFENAGKWSLRLRRLSSSLSAVELESVERVSSSTDITVGSSFRGFFNLACRSAMSSEFSEKDVFERNVGLAFSSKLMLVSWLNERTIPPLSRSRTTGFITSSTPSPTMNCTVSGGVSFPFSLDDESGGSDDSFHVTSVPVNKISTATLQKQSRRFCSKIPDWFFNEQLWYRKKSLLEENLKIFSVQFHFEQDFSFVLCR